MKKALIIIDIQNDYFKEGSFPLWKAEEVLEDTKSAIKLATTKNIPIILIKHVANEPTLFFNKDTEGVKIHKDILDMLPNTDIVIKHYADCFHETRLDKLLVELGVEELLLTGMMTHNCVAFTAVSKTAEKYKVKILSDLTTSVSEPIHLIALSALAPRIEMSSYKDELI